MHELGARNDLLLEVPSGAELLEVSGGQPRRLARGALTVSAAAQRDGSDRGSDRGDGGSAIVLQVGDARLELPPDGRCLKVGDRTWVLSGCSARAAASADGEMLHTVGGWCVGGRVGGWVDTCGCAQLAAPPRPFTPPAAAGAGR